MKYVPIFLKGIEPKKEFQFETFFFKIRITLYKQTNNGFKATTQQDGS